MKFAIGGLPTTVFALLAIVTAAPAAASPDDDFLAALTRNGVSYPSQAGSSLVNAGHSVCQRLAKGDSYQDVAAEVTNGFGGNSGLSRSLMSAATSTLCPEYS